MHFVLKSVTNFKNATPAGVAFFICVKRFRSYTLFLYLYRAVAVVTKAATSAKNVVEPIRAV